MRILDLADERGAYCGKLLADLGADVIKVEPPGGDPARDIGPFYEGLAGRDRSLFFWHYNTNKRSLVLDLARDRAQFGALLDTADVLVATGTPGELARRGLDYASVAAHRRGLIVAAVSPFGQNGPRCEWKSCDTVAQALGGMLFVNGHPDGPPLRSLGLQAYHVAALHAAIGILLALLVRRHSGEGQLVDVSLQESVVAALEHVSGTFHQSGEIEVRRGTLHWTRAFRVGRCRDGYVLLSSVGDWTSLVEWIKADGAARDVDAPAWEEEEYRRTHHEQLFAVLDEWVRRYAVADLVARAQLRRLPFAAVLPIEALLDHPQLAAREFFVDLRHEELARTFRYPGPPYRFSATPWQLRRRAPLIGEGEAGDRRWATGREEETGAGRPETGARRDTSDEIREALHGIRVLDFTWVVAGPVATRVLADYGADVIKVERLDAGDFSDRRAGLSGNLNRGKRSLAVNMDDPRGAALVRNLIRRCDVVIDNFSSRVMRNWGLDYSALCAIKPEIIAVSMSGFGASGPHQHHVSYGPTLQALAGYTWHMRHPGGEPAGWGFSYADMAAGYSAALAVLVALWHREQTGAGQFIDLAQFEALVALIGPELLAASIHGRASPPLGNRSPERPGVPHGVYRCRDLPGDGPARDRWCAIAVFTDEEWAGCVRALGAPAWAQASRFATLAERLAHRDEIDARLEEWTKQHTAEEVMEAMQAERVAAGVVANAEDLCARDPHLRSRGYWVAIDTPEGRRLIFDGVPVRLSATPGRVRAPGPLLGEHTDQILRELLDLEQTAIRRLRDDGVIA